MSDTSPAPLSANFFRGSLAGQIASVYKDREKNTAKVDAFKAAIAEGKITLAGATITKQQATKLAALGVDLPDSVTIKSPARPAASAAA